MATHPDLDPAQCLFCAIDRWTTRTRRLYALATALVVASVLAGVAAWRLDTGYSDLRRSIDALRVAGPRSTAARDIVVLYSRCALDDSDLPPQVHHDLLGDVWQREVRCASPTHAAPLQDVNIWHEGYFWTSHTGSTDPVYLRAAVAALARLRLEGDDGYGDPNQMIDFMGHKLGVIEARAGWPRRVASGASVVLSLGALASAVGAMRTGQRLRRLRGAVDGERSPYRDAGRVTCARHAA